jgi:L-ascorbate metabolism protein UlaG (beta-lactamase superfamily)
LKQLDDSLCCRIVLFKKLNEDSSWWWELNSTTILVDPWFTASQVDVAPWFSRQYHLAQQPRIEELNLPDFVFISNVFSDHCNRETLLQLDSHLPIIGSDKVLRKINKWGHFSHLISLEKAPVSIQHIPSGNWLDLVHDAYLFSTHEGKVLYAPHGSRLKNPPETEVLITTTAEYQLPFWLGGTVNLGLASALELKQRSHAKVLLATHDEPKKGEGLVEQLAKKTYVKQAFDTFISLQAGESFVYPS